MVLYKTVVLKCEKKDCPDNIDGQCRQFDIFIDKDGKCKQQKSDKS